MILDLESALTIAKVARETASAEEIAVALVIVDDRGTSLLTQRMDGAYLSAIPIATKKAFTAVNFRVPTHEMADRLSPLDYQSLVSAADERLTFLKGGIPIISEDIVVGAIGISGGSGDQDLACCEAAIAAFATLAK